MRQRSTDVQMVTDLLPWCLKLTIVFSNVFGTLVSAQTLYFDNYDDCAIGQPFSLDEGQQYTVMARGGAAYSTLKCTLVFKSLTDEPVCIDVDSIRINSCSVSLSVYDKSSSTGDKLTTFSCGDEGRTVCGTGRYMSLYLKKRPIDNYDYNFQLTIRDRSQGEAFDSLDTLIKPIGVIIGIIIAVVVLIAVLAVVLVCCCCKSKTTSQGRVYRRAEGDVIQTNTHSITIPSAPPPPCTEDDPKGQLNIYPSQEPSQHTYSPPSLYPQHALASIDSPPAYSAQPPAYTSVPGPVRV